MQLKRSSHCSVCTKAAHLIAQQSAVNNMDILLYVSTVDLREVDPQVTFLRHDLVHGSC